MCKSLLSIWFLFSYLYIVQVIYLSGSSLLRSGAAVASPDSLYPASKISYNEAIAQLGKNGLPHWLHWKV